jgi:hypothetical protein
MNTQTTQISYTDGAERIVEFPVEANNLRNLKIDGREIMDIHDLTLSLQMQGKQLKVIAIFCGLVASLVLAIEIYSLTI